MAVQRGRRGGTEGTGRRPAGGEGRGAPAATLGAAVLAAALAAGLVPAAARAQVPGDEGSEDTAAWIAKACPADGSAEALVRLDPVAGKAVMDLLRRGALRESVRAAAAYLACWERQGDLRRLPVFLPRIQSLRQVVCFVPLVIFEGEGRVDAALAAEALARCPEPAAKPSGPGAEAARRWGEEVRRHLHLVAACREAPEVLDAALGWLQRMRDAGIVGPDGTALWAGAGGPGDRAGDGGTAARPADGKGAGAAPEGAEGGEGAGGEDGGDAEGADGGREAAEEDAGPDPVFAVRVLAAGAAVAAGDLPRLLAAFGGEQEACRSPFLAALGFLQAVELPQTAALPLILKALVARSDLARMADLSEAVARRFQGRPCAAQALVSSLVLGSLPPSEADRAVEGGRTALLVRVAAAAPAVVPVRGKARTRVAVLEALVPRLAGEARAERLCQLGQARLETGDDRRALEDFDQAAAAGSVDAATAAPGTAAPAAPGTAGPAGGAAPGEGAGASAEARSCAVEGRLRALLAGGRTGDPLFPAALEAWLKGRPEPAEVLARVLGPADDARRAAAVGAFAAAARDPASPSREAVLEALVKVADDRPGSLAAAAAVAEVGAAGWPPAGEDRVIWDLVRGRHHVKAGEDRPAREALDRAFRDLRPGMDSARGGVAALLRWLAGDRHYAWLDRLVPRARKAGILTPGLLAEVAASVGEVGERDRARRLLAVARQLKPGSREVWVALADASARMDDVEAALRDLRRAGPEEDWGPEAFKVKGRIDTARGRHRDAVAAYARAVEAEPGECEPRFFRGLALLLVGDPEGAEADFRACLAGGNRGSQVRGALGYALFDQSRLEPAEATFREALADDPDSADNHLGLALVLLRRGDAGGAVRSFRDAVSREPAFGKGLKAASVKGYVYSEVQKKAFEDLVRAAREAGGAR